MNRPKKIGLALGGGGARGLAHIGVIKALEQAGIKIDFIAGTSMGALVGGFYAATGDIKFLEDEFLSLRKSDILSTRKIMRKQDGILFRDQTIIENLESHVRGKRVEDCKVSFRAVATDVENGNEVIINKGELVQAVKDKFGCPVAFKPVSVGGKLLMDGGFVNPVPADVVRNMGAEYVIAVDTSTSRWAPMPPDGLIHLRDIAWFVLDSFSVFEYQLIKHITEKADLFIKPTVSSFGWLDFNEAKAIIDAGYKEIKIHLNEIRKATGYPAPHRTPLEKFIDFLFEA